MHFPRDFGVARFIRPKHRQVAKAEKSSATDLLDQEFARADSILADRIDGLMKQLQGSGTTFYSDYINARKIINTGAKKPATPPPPGP